MEITSFDLAEFQRRLGETIAWYLSKVPIADPEHGLRTEALAPSGDVAHPTRKVWSDFPRPWTDEMWNEYRRAQSQAPQQRQGIVDEVARKRRTLLRMSRLDHPQQKESLGRGRLLVYEPELNLYDGAAMNASEGFFDGDNVPPWDTWLAYIVDTVEENQTYLIAWVPPELLELASDGIDVNPEDCIRWAGNVDAEFVRQLRSAGLLRQE